MISACSVFLVQVGLCHLPIEWPQWRQLNFYTERTESRNLSRRGGRGGGQSDLGAHFHLVLCNRYTAVFIRLYALEETGANGDYRGESF